MSLLPQRKKSAEEIARLREEMGLPSPPTAAVAESPVDAPVPEPEVEEAPAFRPRGKAKTVRSLRRSERVPLPDRQAAASAVVPTLRHSDDELDRMRRLEAMQAVSMEVPPAVSHLNLITAHPALVILGYVLAFAGGIGAFPVAVFIAMKKPRSRHHAGFMATIALFVLVFGALHYFPNLNPAAHAS